MNRPDFITSEQINRWDENIKNDDALQTLMKSEGYSNSDSFKEMLYASLWLNESMNEMGFDPLTIAEASVFLGQESVQSDAWDVAKILVDAYVAVKEIANKPN